MESINISWETISDELTVEDQGLEGEMRSHLDTGNELIVEIPDGTTKTFTGAEEFSEWLNMLKTPPGQKSD